jgi:hypothetical protein
MLPLLPAVQAIWPYLLVFWLIPFLIIAVKMMRRPAVSRPDDGRYVNDHDLFSPAQRSLFGALEQAVGEDFLIFGKVPVAAVVGASRKSDQSAWQFSFKEIRSKHFEFVLCDKQDLSICAAVALIDDAHRSPAPHGGDAFLENICRAISLPLIQIQEAPDYSVIALKKAIAARVAPGSRAAATRREEPFSAELAMDPRLDERPWTLEESAPLGGRRSDSENRETAWKLTSDVER